MNRTGRSDARASLTDGSSATEPLGTGSGPAARERVRGRPSGPAASPRTHKLREFEEEALPHIEAIRAFSLRLAGSVTDADDLVQETYLRAFRFWHRYTPGTNCKSWLFTICRNAFLRRWNRRTRHREIVESEAPSALRTPLRRSEGALATRVSDPERTSLGHIVTEKVLDAVDELPSVYRESLRLRLVDELAYQEVADVLDVPVGTVKSRVHRGRLILQETLREYGP